MALLDDVRASFGITSKQTDAVLQGLIASALEDMRRVGVREELLDPNALNPMVAHAVKAHCHAFYNVDAVQSPVWHSSYRATVTALMNSDRSDWLYEEPEAEEETDPDPQAEDEGTTGEGEG